jgi:hypothetical protein
MGKTAGRNGNGRRRRRDMDMNFGTLARETLTRPE